MKSLLISLIWSLVRSLVAAGLGDAVLRLVRDAATLPGMTGPERKQWVREQLNDLSRIGMVAITQVAESVINLVIEAAVQKARLKS